jgi:hypothetical protein
MRVSSFKKCGIMAAMVLAVLMMAIAGGCTPVKQAGEATASFVRGDLVIDEVEYPIDEVYDATLKAMSQLDLTVTEKDQNPLDAKVVARDSEDRKIQIITDRVTTETTRLKIRIGLTGDERASMAIYDQILKNLN